jgi:hypothetical protein
MLKTIFAGFVTHWVIVASATLGTAALTIGSYYLFSERTDWIAVSGLEVTEKAVSAFPPGQLSMQLVKTPFGTRCEIQGLEYGQVNFVFHDYSQGTTELTGETFCDEHTGLLGKGTYRRLDDNRIEIHVSNEMLRDRERTRAWTFTFVSESYFLKNHTRSAATFDKIKTWNTGPVPVKQPGGTLTTDRFKLSRVGNADNCSLECSSEKGAYRAIFADHFAGELRAIVGVVHDSSDKQVGWASLTKNVDGSMSIAAFQNVGKRECLFVADLNPISTQ